MMNAIQASPTKSNTPDIEQNARYFRSHVMTEFENKCHPIKSTNFNQYNACLENYDPLISLPFLKTVLKHSTNETFAPQDVFVSKCKSVMKNEMPKTGVTQYCKDIHPHFVRAHAAYKTVPNDFAYHLD